MPRPSGPEELGFVRWYLPHIAVVWGALIVLNDVRQLVFEGHIRYGIGGLIALLLGFAMVLAGVWEIKKRRRRARAWEVRRMTRAGATDSRAQSDH